MRSCISILIWSDCNVQSDIDAKHICNHGVELEEIEKEMPIKVRMQLNMIDC